MIQNIKSLGTRMLVAAAVSAAALSFGAGAAEARTSIVVGGHFGGPNYYGSHYWGGPRISLGFGVGPYWGGYYAPYYYPYAYYPAPVVYRDYDGYSDWDHRQGVLASPYVQQALAADVGEPVTWARGGVIGRVTTTRDGWSGEKYCREFVENVTINDSTHETTGTACQAPGGAWQMVANQR